MSVAFLPVELLEETVLIAKHAGKIIAEYFINGYTIETKADNSPLTSADLAAHNHIVEQLTRLHTGYPILSEESTRISFTQRSQWNSYWLIDPLDGTREFVKGLPDFTVNIALIHHHCPVLGVIHVPMQNTTYLAMHGQSAYKETPNENRVRIHTRALVLQNPTVCGSHSHTGKKMQSFLQRLGDHQLIARGSSLKSCLIAEGSADIYPRFGPTSEWDTAAAQCILEVAGGSLLDMQLQPLRYNTKDSLLNPHFIAIGDQSFDWSKYLD